MISEDLEFLISQYVDGTISPADRAALEARLADDPDARLLVHEYRKLQDILASASTPLPDLDFEALSARINDAIDQQADVSRRRLRIGWFITAGAGLAVAASVLLVFNLFLHGPSITNTSVAIKPTAPAVITPAPKVQVAVLVPDEKTAGPAVADVQVGPPPGRSYRAISEAIVTRPNTLFIAKADDPAQDTPRVPY